MLLRKVPDVLVRGQVYKQTAVDRLQALVSIELIAEQLKTNSDIFTGPIERN